MIDVFLSDWDRLQKRMNVRPRKLNKTTWALLARACFGLMWILFAQACSSTSMWGWGAATPGTFELVNGLVLDSKAPSISKGYPVIVRAERGCMAIGTAFIDDLSDGVVRVKMKTGCGLVDGSALIFRGRVHTSKMGGPEALDKGYTVARAEAVERGDKKMVAEIDAKRSASAYQETLQPRTYIELKGGELNL